MAEEIVVTVDDTQETVSLFVDDGVTAHSELTLDDGTNPHATTKTDVGLGSVPNTDFTTAVGLNTAKVGITPTQASDITTNNAKDTNIAHPLVETAVPLGAVFTDTVYDDTVIQAEVDLNTAKKTSKFIDGTDPLDAVYMDGNVGIGKQPVIKLDIDGGVCISDNLDIGALVSTGKVNITQNDNSSSLVIDNNNSTGAAFNMSTNRYGIYVNSLESTTTTNRFLISLASKSVVKFIVGTNGRAAIGHSTTNAQLDVNGGVKIADDTDVASVDKVGTFRYRVVNGLGVAQVCVETGALAYAWVNVKIDDRESVEGNLGATLALDFNDYETWTGTLTEALTLSITNPKVKVVTLDLTGDFAITYPAGSTVVGDTYDGTGNNKITIEWKASSIFITVTNY